jgi:hypothetical protein
MVRDLQEGTGVPSQTVASFLMKHEKLLLPQTWPERIAAARATFANTVLIVDEASMPSSEQALKLVQLANLLSVERLVFVGDKRQLGAIDAGKPFAIMQKTGTETAQMPENLRARSELMKTVATAAQAGRMGNAFAAMRDRVVEAPGRLAETAADLWMGLAPDERERTILLTSGRELKGETNRLVQEKRLAAGELGSEALRLTVLDRVSITREEERHLAAYTPGLVAEFERAIPSQKLDRGRYTVVRVDRLKETVTVLGVDGRERKLQPKRLAPNRKQDNVRLYREKQLELRAGDRLRWGDNDKQRGLDNAAIARVLAVDAAGNLTVETATKMVLTLPASDPMLQKIDLGYTLNMHMAQGVTADRGIMIMSAHEKKLSTEQLALVAFTRVREDMIAVVDDLARLVRTVTANSGEKTSALEITGAVEKDGGAGQAMPRNPQQPQADNPGTSTAASALPPSGTRSPASPEIERKIDGGGARQIEFDI